MKLASLAPIAVVSLGVLPGASDEGQAPAGESRTLVRSFWSQYTARSNRTAVPSMFGGVEVSEGISSFTYGTEWTLEETLEPVPGLVGPRILRDYLDAIEADEAIVDGTFRRSESRSPFEGERVVFEQEEDGSYSARPSSTDPGRVAQARDLRPDLSLEFVLPPDETTEEWGIDPGHLVHLLRPAGRLFPDQEPPSSPFAREGSHLVLAVMTFDVRPFFEDPRGSLTARRMESGPGKVVVEIDIDLRGECTLEGGVSDHFVWQPGAADPSFEKAVSVEMKGIARVTWDLEGGFAEEFRLECDLRVEEVLIEDWSGDWLGTFTCQGVTRPARETRERR